MKNIFKKSLAVLMLMFAFTCINTATAKAEVTAGQFLQPTITNITENSATVNYSYTGSASYFHTYLSIDGVNFSYKDYSMGGNDRIDNLAPNTHYFVKIVVAEGSGENKGTNIASPVVDFYTLPTKPQDIQSIYLIGNSSNSLTISWTPSVGATGYMVYLHSNGVDVPVAQVADTQITIPGLMPNSNYDVRVQPIAQNLGGTSEGDVKSIWSDFKTKPSTVSTASLHVSTAYQYINSITFAWSGVNADGYQFELYNNNGKKVTSAFTTSTSYGTSLPKGKAYMYRVRPYVNLGNGGKAYGSWSGYKFHALSSKMTAKVLSGRRIKASWTKVAGAKNYTVSISAQSSSTGYKKVKTTKGRSIVIKKCGKQRLKKGKTYYIKVQPNINIKKKKGKGNFYNYVSVYISLFAR